MASYARTNQRAVLSPAASAPAPYSSRARTSPAAAQMMQLQQTLGNRGTARWLNAQLGSAAAPLQAKSAVAQRAAGDPPQRLDALITEGQALIQDVTAHQNELTIRKTYSGHDWDAAILGNLQALVNKWTPYRDSFNAGRPGGDAKLFPAKASYNADYDLMQMYRTRHDAIMAFDVNQFKLDWVTNQIAQQNRWAAIGLAQATILAQPNEVRNAFRGRIKGIVRQYLQRDYNWIYGVLGIHGGDVKSWDLGTGYHTTLYKRNGNPSFQVDNMAAVITTILGNGMNGLHVTYEQHGQNNNYNPKIYITGEQLYCGGLQNATLNTMQNRLTARENAIRNAIQQHANLLINRLKAGWDVA